MASLNLNLLNLKKIRNKVEEIIISAEMDSIHSGVPVIELYSEYVKELAKEDKTLAIAIKEILSRLQRGEKTINAYRGYISDDLLHLLRLADERNVSPSVIFENYAPVKKELDKRESQIKNATRLPLIKFFIFSFIFYFPLSKLINISDQTDVLRLSKFAYSIHDLYPVIIITVAVVYYLVVRSLRENLPIIGNVYKGIKASLMLILINTLYRLGLAPKEIIPIIKEYAGVRVGGVSPSISGLINIMRNYLSPIERANLIVAGTSRFEEELKNIAEKKLTFVETSTETAREILDNIGYLLLLIPLGMFLSVIGELLFKVMDLIQ